jgi:hypothetical protein
MTWIDPSEKIAERRVKLEQEGDSWKISLLTPDGVVFCSKLFRSYEQAVSAHGLMVGFLAGYVREGWKKGKEHAQASVPSND